MEECFEDIILQCFPTNHKGIAKAFIGCVKSFNVVKHNTKLHHFSTFANVINKIDVKSPDAVSKLAKAVGDHWKPFWRMICSVNI